MQGFNKASNTQDNVIRTAIQIWTASENSKQSPEQAQQLALALSLSWVWSAFLPEGTDGREAG